MRYGFVIDHRKCIGCHACTVACKEENRVPLGAFRTWVKYVEKGTFPDTRRYFAVLRCNHCDDAPCVTICPTVALYRRPDGIVDLDGARCIGCKSCMQACPYDALYIDPNTSTAAKCHYCAHRIEVGLEPACVIVCPERAIVAGDLDDPATEIARLVAREQVAVRKPEQGTRPKLFYVGVDAAALTPQLQRAATTYLWSERPAAELDLVRMVADVNAGGADASLARLVYDAPHAPRPWGWKVGAYLWTKSIAAGALMVAAFGVGPDPVLTIGAPLLALAFLAVTTALLIFDLRRPDRFAYLVLKPNWRSWLVWGAWILMAFGIVAVAWLVAGAVGAEAWLRGTRIAGFVLALGAAGYSALLFGQAEGRDFWQSPLVLPHLIVSAAVAGVAGLTLVSVPWHNPVMVRGAVGHVPAGFSVTTFTPVLALLLLLHGALLAVELFSRHAAHDATVASRLIVRGAYRGRFWGGVVIGGIVAPIGFALVDAVWLSTSAILAAIPAVLALAGLWLWEDVWVKTGQSIPLS